MPDITVLPDTIKEAMIASEKDRGVQYYLYCPVDPGGYEFSAKHPSEAGVALRVATGMMTFLDGKCTVIFGADELEKSVPV